MAILSSAESRRLDDAARAGWLYYVAGNTQDEIAKKLGLSRQSAQRMVALAVSEGLIKVRLDHPIARCMQLSLRVKDRFRLRACEVVPSDPNDPTSIVGLAQAGANELERFLKSEEGKVLAFGTGRTLRACVDELPPMTCSQHKIVSLLGNMMADGSASAYDVVVRMSDRVKAKHYPMPLPVLSKSAKEKEILHGLGHVHNILELVKQADVTFVGIGHMANNSPIFLDGFITEKELDVLQKSGAVGEMIGWIYDQQGELVKGAVNNRVASAPLMVNPEATVFGIAAGDAKIKAILGALRGKRINALITNEHTAELLLEND
jgi:DNA-binding transcriptional regulator LsrR (DeoR family)